MSENLGFAAVFDAGTEKIEIKKEKIGPRADSKIKPDKIRTGKSIEIKDSSSAGEGEIIVERQWKINDAAGNAVSAKNPEDFFPVRQAESYSVKLRVKNDLDHRSEWRERSIEALPNQPPEIDYLSVSLENQLRVGLLI